MRLKPEEIRIIHHSVTEVFGEATAVRLFGSRVDDQKRGGDIDLFVATQLPTDERLRRRFQLLRLLHTRLGEQKIDLVLADPNNPSDADSLIVREALATGVEL